MARLSEVKPRLVDLGIVPDTQSKHPVDALFKMTARPSRKRLARPGSRSR